MVSIWDLEGPTGKDGIPEGPLQLTMNTVVAKEALQRDPQRYVAVLPKNLSPGRAEIERRDREARLKAELESEQLPDPHFPSGRPKK